MKINEGINKKLIISSSLAVLCYIAILVIFQKRTMGGIIFNSSKWTIVFMMMIVIMTAIIAFVVYNNERFELEKKFVIISATMGMLFIIIVPVFQVADEVVHSFRAYDLAKGRVFYQSHEESMMLPESIMELYYASDVERIAFHGEEKIDKSKYKEFSSLPLNKGKIKEYDANGTSAYTSIAYLPQAIGIFLGDLLGLPIYFVLLLGRITNLMCWIAIGYFALKIMPIKKELLMFVMLLPMTINQASSLSPDAILNASSFMLIAYIMYLKFEKDKVEIKDILIIMLATLGIVSVKMPYILLSGLLLTVPNNKFFSNIKNKYLCYFKSIVAFLSIMIVSIMVFALWGKVSKPIIKVEAYSAIENNIQEEQDVDEFGYSDTIKHIINNPREFLTNMKSTLDSQGERYREGFIGIFGWIDTHMPNYMIKLVTFIGLFLIINGGKYVKITVWDRIVYLGMGIGLFATLCAVSLSWYEPTFVNEHRFFPGLQGRYFIPFAIPFFIAFYQSKFKIDFKKNSWIIPSFMTFILCFAINVLIMRYWV